MDFIIVLIGKSKANKIMAIVTILIGDAEQLYISDHTKQNVMIMNYSGMNLSKQIE